MNNNIRYPEFIFNIINMISPQAYLELGIYMGEVFEKICSIVPKCVGVDTKDVRTNSNVGTFYQTTTDEFFITNREKFDVVFIDADHRYESVYKDLINSLKILNHQGTIFLHDTDPIDELHHRPGLCGDAYRIIDDTHSLNLDAVTFPISKEGVTIVRRKEDRRVLACL